MKAIEFVKKHGWYAVINAVKSTNAEETAAFESTDLEPILSKDGETIGFNVKVHQINFNDVKKIVDAFELVESFNGLDMAKKFFDENLECADSENLKQAINLVEKCNG